MTATYIEVAAKMEAAKAARRRLSLSGMLDFLGVSRSGYRAFLKHRPSELSCVRNGSRNGFRRSTTTPTRTTELQRSPGSFRRKENGSPNALLASTCGRWGSGPNGLNPGSLQPLTPTSVRNCTTSWMRSSILIVPTPYGVLTSPTSTPKKDLLT